MGSASRSSFFGFEIAKTGLFISQHNLNVTGHNIANVNTPGYTRQRLVTSAIEPYSTIGRLATYEHGILGGGTRSHYVEQLRNDYLDREFRLQNSAVNTWSSRLTSLEFIEQIFDEPNEVGVLDHLQGFHDALNDLVVKSPGQPQRAEIQSAAKKLADVFNQYYRQLVDQQAGLNNQVEAKVNQVNRLSTAIGDLNKLIYNFEITGEHANDLRDQRNVLLDELSSLVEIEVKEYKTVDHEPARLSVRMGEGTSQGYLVDHTTVNQLYMQQVDNRIQSDPDNVVGDPEDKVWVVMWGDSEADPPTYISRDETTKPPPTANTTATYPAAYNGLPVPVPPDPPYVLPYQPPTNAQMEAMYNLLGEGEIKGMLTMRDGDHSKNIGIPYLVHQLDTLARSIVKEFNAVHNQGYPDPRSGLTGPMPGWPPPPVPPATEPLPGYGIDFFDDFGAATDAAYAKITAGTFKLDDAMSDPDDVWRIACSDVPVTDDNQEGNNHNTIENMLGLFDRKDLATVANYKDFYDSFILAVAFTTDFARTQQTNMEILAISADTQRMSISAVSIDEEMTNMIKFQHAYAASSRVITAMDECLDRIINGMGMVGR